VLIRIVAPKVAGSSPVGHPSNTLYRKQNTRKNWLSAYPRSLLVLQCHLALPGSAASVSGILQRSLIIFATH
jgi:hypothetical protein